MNDFWVSERGVSYDATKIPFSTLHLIQDTLSI